MPELPEVQTVVSDLKPILRGRRFLGIKSAVSGMLGGDFEAARGGIVQDVKRRGKFMNIFLDNNTVMTIHLRMTGRILARDSKDAGLKFERVRMEFEENSLRFCDQRKFGKVWACDRDEYEKITGQWKLGVEPLNEEFDLKFLQGLVEGRKGSLKRFLLDQTKIAGIGNIYADETCFYARVRPEAALENLNEKRLEKIFEGIVKSLRQGIENRGTSVSDYQDAYGKSGRNQEVLYVYGRAGKPCLECGNVLKKIKEAGRGTVFCEECQKF